MKALIRIGLIFILMVVVTFTSFAQYVIEQEYNDDSLSAVSMSGIVIDVPQQGSCPFTRGKSVLTFLYTADIDNEYQFYDQGFTSSLTFTVKGYNASGDTILITQPVEFYLDDDTPSVMTIIDFTALNNDITGFDIIVDDYDQPSADFIPYIRLIATMTMELHIDVSNEDVTIPELVNTSHNRATFEWECDCPVNNYEFQLLRLFSTDGEDSCDYDSTYADWRFALSLETESDADSLELTIAEGTGLYAWRVRPIGNMYPGGKADSRNLGLWSLSDVDQGWNEDISDGSDGVFCYYQYGQDRNWIYSRSFAEGSASEQAT